VSGFLTSCSGRSRGDGGKKIVIAEQYGLAYAPLQIMRINKFLEEELPDREIEWKKLINTASIREAMLTGDLDIGFMGIPPFLIGYGNGMEWKIFTGLSMVPVDLITWRDDISSLADFKSSDRIALPQPGSIQHILLSMAAEKELGNAKYFDNQLLTMSHPDGMNALIQKKDVTAHFTTPPFLMAELKLPGFKSVLKGKDAAGGDFTFAAGAVTDKFSRENREALEAFKKALNRASQFISDYPQQASEILSDEYNIPESDLMVYLTWEDMSFGTDIKGTDSFINFMKRNSYLREDMDFSGIILE
jgi:NitT/TauT family transport system substrate-binding protein